MRERLSQALATNSRGLELKSFIETVRSRPATSRGVRTAAVTGSDRQCPSPGYGCEQAVLWITQARCSKDPDIALPTLVLLRIERKSPSTSRAGIGQQLWRSCFGMGEVYRTGRHESRPAEGNAQCLARKFLLTSADRHKVGSECAPFTASNSSENIQGRLPGIGCQPSQGW